MQPGAGILFERDVNISHNGLCYAKSPATYWQQIIYQTTSVIILLL